MNKKSIFSSALAIGIFVSLAACKEDDNGGGNGNVTTKVPDLSASASADSSSGVGVTTAETSKAREPQNNDYVEKDGIVYQLKVGKRDGVDVIEAFPYSFVEGFFETNTSIAGKDDNGFDVEVKIITENITIPLKIENPTYSTYYSSANPGEFYEGEILVADILRDDGNFLSNMHISGNLTKTIILPPLKEIRVPSAAETVIITDGTEKLSFLDLFQGYYIFEAMYGEDNAKGKKVTLDIPASVTEILPDGLDTSNVTLSCEGRDLIKIICPAGSYAEQFAKDNGIECEVK